MVHCADAKVQCTMLSVRANPGWARVPSIEPAEKGRLEIGGLFRLHIEVGLEGEDVVGFPVRFGIHRRAPPLPANLTRSFRAVGSSHTTLAAFAAA